MNQRPTRAQRSSLRVHPFDTAALAAYLRAEVADFAGDPVVEQFQGGQSNPTYRITAGRATVRAPPQAAGPAAAVRARGGPRIPGAVGARRHRRSGGEDLRAVRGRLGARHPVLRDGVRRGPHPLGPDAPGHDAGAARGALRRAQSGHRRAAPRRLRGRRAFPTTASPATTSSGRSPAGRSNTRRPPPSGFRRWTG